MIVPAQHGDHPFFDQIPELYATDTALMELVSLFEEAFLETEKEIDNLPELLYCPQNAPDGFLDFLGFLVGLKNENHLFTFAQMRALIPVARQIQIRKGTRWAMQKMISVYLETLCGHPVPPIIIEYQDWIDSDMPAEIVEACPGWYRLEMDVVILLPPEPLLKAPEELARLNALAELYCPAIARVFVVEMQDTIVFGQNCFLDINTYL